MKTTAYLTVTWYGHSAFKIVSPSGQIVLVDPWLDNPKAPPQAKEISQAHLILVSHGHADHVGNTVELAARTNARVLSIYELSLFLAQKGVTTAQGMNKGGTVTLDGLSVTMVDARHSADIDGSGTVIPGGEAAGFVIRFDNGRTVYHAGDTGVFGDMKIIGELYAPDVVLLPIGDLYTMGPREAAYACRLLKPKTIIGMHYGTFPALTGTPAALRKLLPAPMRNRVLELTPGAATKI